MYLKSEGSIPHFFCFICMTEMKKKKAERHHDMMLRKNDKSFFPIIKMKGVRRYYS